MNKQIHFNIDPTAIKVSRDYIKLDPRYPSRTIMANTYRPHIHPWEDRYINDRETARLQSIPDDFTFAGKGGHVGSQIINQLGMMTPPVGIEPILRVVWEALHNGS